MTDVPDWIKPGDVATLVWYDAVDTRPDGVRVYQIAGPMLDGVPRSPYFLLAPVEASAFAERLYRHEPTITDLREFLEGCVLASGWMSEMLDAVFARHETRPLSVLDAWREATGRPVVPYQPELDAFLCNDLPPVYVSPEAHAAVQRIAESFMTASVCAECGDAQDAGVFFWTVSRGPRVRVCLLIMNEGGRWTCHLHPFEFEAEVANVP